MCTKSPNHYILHKSQHRDGDGIPCTDEGACWRGLHFAEADRGALAVVKESTPLGLGLGDGGTLLLFSRDRVERWRPMKRGSSGDVAARQGGVRPFSEVTARRGRTATQRGRGSQGRPSNVTVGSGWQNRKYNGSSV